METEAEIATFFSKVVLPAFEEIKSDLEKYQRDVRVSSSKNVASIAIRYKGEPEVTYSIRVDVHHRSAIPHVETEFIEQTNGKMYRSKGVLRSGLQNYTIADIRKEEIIKYCLADYKRHVRKV